MQLSLSEYFRALRFSHAHSRNQLLQKPNPTYYLVLLFPPPAPLELNTGAGGTIPHATNKHPQGVPSYLVTHFLGGT